ncbi:MAG: hypothetical protein FD126_2683, partial [Elusimicrobia bacterium]
MTPRENRRKPQELDTGLWMVPYADLMSNLMILFMALFVQSYALRGASLDNVLSQVEAAMAEPSAAASAKRRLDESKLAVALEKVVAGITLDEMGV